MNKLNVNQVAKIIFDNGFVRYSVKREQYVITSELRRAVGKLLPSSPSVKAKDAKAKEYTLNIYIDDQYGTFINEYPNCERKSKDDNSYNEYSKLIITGISPNSILEGLKKWKYSNMWKDEKFIPFPSVFLRKRMFDKPIFTKKDNADPLHKKNNKDSEVLKIIEDLDL